MDLFSYKGLHKNLIKGIICCNYISINILLQNYRVFVFALNSIELVRISKECWHSHIKIILSSFVSTMVIMHNKCIQIFHFNWINSIKILVEIFIKVNIPTTLISFWAYIQSVKSSINMKCACYNSTDHNKLELNFY